MMSFHIRVLLVSKVCMLSKSVCQRLSLNVSSLSTKFQLFPSCNFRALVYSRSIYKGIFKEHWYSRSIGIFKDSLNCSFRPFFCQFDQFDLFTKILASKKLDIKGVFFLNLRNLLNSENSRLPKTDS